MAHRAAPTLPTAVEQRRLAALHGYEILDSPREAVFDDITGIAAGQCGTPMALVSLVDEQRQWFKSERGLGCRQTSIEASLCAHTILHDALMVVPDTRQDPRFAEGPLVAGAPHLRFYAGAPLQTSEGLRIGTVCVLDTVARHITPAQGELLQALARQVMSQLELRRMLILSERTSQAHARLLSSAGHHFRTPMTTAMLAFDLARQATTSDKREQISKMGQDALFIVDAGLSRMIAAVRGEAAFERGELMDTDIDAVLANIIATHAGYARQRRVRLRAVRTRCTALTDATQLETLLGNLVSNAIRCTPSGGRVLLGCRRRGATLDIEVLDNGPGIDAARLAGLHGAFGVADLDRQTLGLGLWIVRQSASSLGIRIQASAVPGRGTRFVLHIPDTSAIAKAAGETTAH